MSFYSILFHHHPHSVVCFHDLHGAKLQREHSSDDSVSQPEDWCFARSIDQEVKRWDWGILSIESVVLGTVTDMSICTDVDHLTGNRLWKFFDAMTCCRRLRCCFWCCVDLLWIWILRRRRRRSDAMSVGNGINIQMCNQHVPNSYHHICLPVSFHQLLPVHNLCIRLQIETLSVTYASLALWLLEANYLLA